MPRKPGAKALAMAHLTGVLEDAKASQARKDKAARLILAHISATAPPKRGRAKPAAVDKGKKEIAHDEAAEAAGGGSKWGALLQ